MTTAWLINLQDNLHAKQWGHIDTLLMQCICGVETSRFECDCIYDYASSLSGAHHKTTKYCPKLFRTKIVLKILIYKHLSVQDSVSRKGSARLCKLKVGSTTSSWWLQVNLRVTWAILIMVITISNQGFDFVAFKPQAFWIAWWAEKRTWTNVSLSKMFVLPRKVPVPAIIVC